MLGSLRRGKDPKAIMCRGYMDDGGAGPCPLSKWCKQLDVMIFHWKMSISMSIARQCQHLGGIIFHWKMSMPIARQWQQLGGIFVHVVLAQHSERIGKVEVANKRAEEDFQEDIPLQSASSSELICKGAATVQAYFIVRQYIISSRFSSSSSRNQIPMDVEWLMQIIRRCRWRGKMCLCVCS